MEEVLDLDHERRQLIVRRLSEAAVAIRSNPDLDLEKTVKTLGLDLGRLMPNGSIDDNYFWTTTKLSEVALQYIEERRANKGLPGFHTGFTRLDEGLGGFERDNIYTVNARSGMGKTTILAQFGWKLADQTTVVYFSPEARAKMLARRLICSLAGVPNFLVRRGEIDETQWKALRQAAKVMKTRPIYFYDLPNISVSQMKTIMERVYHESGNYPGAVIIDYLQQLEGEDSFQQITNNMKEIETFTVEANVAMVTASQVGRSSGDGSAQDSGKGSGKIEELSSVVMGLTYIKLKEKEEPPPDYKLLRLLNVSKNREEGDQFFIPLKFDQITGLLYEV